MSEKEILELLLSKMTNIENKVDNVDNRIDSIDNRIDSVDNRIVSIDNRMNKIENRIDRMENRMDSLENNLNSKFDNLQGQFDVVSNEVINIKTTLENETNKNMQVIAEGHENLNYKLDKAVQYSNKMEIIEIRINRLESEIEKLKKFA